MSSASESDTEDDYTSSEDVTEDEEGEELSPALDAAILQVLSKIKSGQGVYGKEQVLAEALLAAESKASALTSLSKQKKEKEKPYLLADHHRAALLNEANGHNDEETDGDAGLTHVQSQRLMRLDAIDAFKNFAVESDDEASGDTEEEGGLLKKRNSDEDEAVREEEEYRKFLLEMGGGEEEVRKILGMGDAPVSWHDGDEGLNAPNTETVKDEDPALSKVEREEREREKKKAKAAKKKADEDFLMNYILNRGWIDKSDTHVPTYDEITTKGLKSRSRADVVENDDEEEEESAQAGPSHPWGVIEEDEFDEKAEEFENAYNFRFEEPGSSNISTHPRTISSLIRRPDEARKTKRALKAEKKAAEKAALDEKTKRLKGEKRREMEKQLKALRAELGENVDWSAIEGVLEGDFDEEQWERIIGEILANAEDPDDAKPHWDEDDGGDAYDDEGGEAWQEDDGDTGLENGYGEAYGSDDGPINMDADFMGDEPKKKFKKKKKGKERAFQEEEADDLTPAQRAEKVKAAMEGYKALDHEDMIGDLATRFKYTRSAPVDFGLTPAEILLATDTELNALVGMKHLAPYRRRGLGKANQGLGKRVRDLREELKGRKWGEEAQPAPRHAKSTGANNTAVGPAKKTEHAEEASGKGGEKGDNVREGGDGGEKRSKKRKGKKERMKAKVADGQAGAIDAVSGDGTADKRQGISHIAPHAVGPVANGDGGDGEHKAKRRKKKKHQKDGAGPGGGGGEMLQMYD